MERDYKFTVTLYGIVISIHALRMERDFGAGRVSAPQNGQKISIHALRMERDPAAP